MSFAGSSPSWRSSRGRCRSRFIARSTQRDKAAALETLIDLGIARVLTSGGASDARQGCDSLRALVEQARGRIVIVAGGGIRAGNAAAIVRASGVHEIHSSTVFDPP